ncbi:phosphotransferase family protein [Nocardia sp. NPDC127579]|uniref:phosphotransferase family protein n=1 Tax=Nocardia sp. NPDC127579 TaxID=3345402 RepID=UPI0036328655
MAAAGGAGAPQLLADRADATVVRVGNRVAKAHSPETVEAALLVRLRFTCHPWLRPILAEPHTGATVRRHRDRLITVWPFGDTVDPDDPNAAPWAEAATLLARLHALPIPPPHRFNCAVRQLDPLPSAGGPARVRRAMHRLVAAGDSVDGAAAAAVRHAHAGLCAELPEIATAPSELASRRSAATASGEVAAPSARRRLVHGDFHLGQLIRLPDRTGNPWRLVDIDDVGVGDPAWDLSRPAAFYAAGILEPIAWERFLNAYRIADGPAVPAAGDPWPALDLPARAVVIQAAALAIVAAGAAGRPLDDIDKALVDTCSRISAWPMTS